MLNYRQHLEKAAGAQKQEPRKLHYADTLCKSRGQCLQGRRIVEGICLLNRKDGRTGNETEEDKGAEKTEYGIVRRLAKNGLIDKGKVIAKVSDVIKKSSKKRNKKKKQDSRKARPPPLILIPP